MEILLLSVKLFWLTNEQHSWRKLSTRNGKRLATRGLFSYRPNRYVSPMTTGLAHSDLVCGITLVFIA